jgi:hypothetical protein
MYQLRLMFSIIAKRYAGGVRFFVLAAFYT